MKKLLLLLAMFSFVFTLAACGDDTSDNDLECGANQEEKDGACVDIVPVCGDDEVLVGNKCEPVELCDAPYVPLYGECFLPYENLPSNTTGRIDLMLWSGSGDFWADLGKQDLAPEDIKAQNDAAAYYVAKEFNKMYPNIVINVKAYAGGPNDNGRIWAQELSNYEDNYGAHPSVWASTDLAGEVEQGLIADLSRFENDPLYQSMNPSILQMMNYYGFQAGLPQYILPWGIFVNKELAAYNNITVPGPDWTIEEYTTFISNKEDDVFYGSFDTPLRIIETGTNSIVKMLFEYEGGDQFVDLDSVEVQNLIPYLQEWEDTARWGNEPSQQFVDLNEGNWGYNWFKNGSILTLEGDPWMMGDCALPDPNASGRCVSSDWDIYPRPSTDYVGNTVGIVLDPMAVYNFCIADGDLSCTAEEELNIKISYTFAAFWVAANKSWEVRANGMYQNGTTIQSALNDSFPVVREGDDFNRQMQYWYTPQKHLRFADTTKMPGFQEVVRLYASGEFWDISDKAYPFFHTVEGTRRENLYEWKNYWNPDVTGGVPKADSAFVDYMLNSLGQWEIETNKRFKEAFEGVQEGLLTYYGYRATDFE